MYNRNEVEEEYRDVVGYEGLYKVSESGAILRLEKVVASAVCSIGKRTLCEKHLTLQKNKYGYTATQLVGHDGLRKHKLIHRLVAEAFIPNPNNFPSLNHMDEVKTNNHYSNLEWCSIRYNNLYNGRQEKITEKLRLNSPFKKAVVQLSLNGKVINDFSSINEACRKTGFNKSGISKCCNNKKEKYNGFMWKFKNN